MSFGGNLKTQERNTLILLVPMKPDPFLLTHLLSSRACSQHGYFCLVKTAAMIFYFFCNFLQPLPVTPLTHSPFSTVAPLLRIWMARRMSKLNRATAAARSHSRSCSRDRRKISTSRSLPRLIQPQSRRARQRSSLT